MFDFITEPLINFLCALYSLWFDPFDGKNHGLLKPNKRETWIHRQARIRGEYFRQVGYADFEAGIEPRSKNPFYLFGYGQAKDKDNAGNVKN